MAFNRILPLLLLLGELKRYMESALVLKEVPTLFTLYLRASGKEHEGLLSHQQLEPASVNISEYLRR